MALRRPQLIKLLAPLLALAATLLVLASMNRSSAPAPPVSAGGGFDGAARSTDDQVRSFQAAIAADPKQPDPYTGLGNAYIQKARETADFAYYQRAELAFARALELGPRNAGALTGMGSLALSRHDFRGGLRYGRQALAIAPGVSRIYGVIVDALVELGRYGEAERALQRMVNLKPNLASYARVSYFRELHGDLRGTIAAMRLAVSAGGDVAENAAYVQTLLGNLQFETGRLGRARHSFRSALADFRDYAPAAAGLARVDAARGDLASATRRYRAVVTRLPLPEYVIALGETELAADRGSAARENLALVRVQEQLLRQSGVNTDTDLALFEANHGDPGRAVALARRSWALAPSVRSADALGWALTRAGHPGEGFAWAKRALAIGSKDAMLLYHAGMSALAAGDRALARTFLGRSLEHNPRFSPLYAPRARQALEGLR
jgi:pentatricopeptide repeat protein